MPAQVNITAETDADFWQTFQFTLPDGVTPISVANCTFSYGVRRSLSDTGVLFRVTSTLSNIPGTATPNGQVTIFNGPQGQFTLWISQAQLLAAPVGIWSHSMIVNFPAGLWAAGAPALAVTLWTGTLTINPGASR